MKYLPKIADWLLSPSSFLDDLLFEAIVLSKRLSHYEYTDRRVSGLDGMLDVNFISPIMEHYDEQGAPLDIQIVHLVFDISRHNPVLLKYCVGELEEQAELLSFDDCAHMEGSGYEDLELIRAVIHDRLKTLKAGKQISNYGILNKVGLELGNLKELLEKGQK